MELNREQIIKDLECCRFGKDEAKCKECNWHPWIKPRCWRLLAYNALSLIKELTEENERLSQSLANSKSILANSKADTVRKMKERLKSEMSFGRYIQADQIDQIANEVLGENK